MASPRHPTRDCPACKGPVEPAGKHRPFCSDRCRLSDLGRWFREDYQASRPLRPDDLDAEEIERRLAEGEGGVANDRRS